MQVWGNAPEEFPPVSQRCKRESNQALASIRKHCAGESRFSALINFSGPDPGASPQANINIAPLALTKAASTYARKTLAAGPALPIVRRQVPIASCQMHRENFLPVSISMANTILIGAQWGDEGKGKIIDVLTAKADVVVRSQGGNNAGHTVIHRGTKFILHLIPSRILRRGKVCVIGNGVVVDPIAVIREIEGLR